MTAFDHYDQPEDDTEFARLASRRRKRMRLVAVVVFVAFVLTFLGAFLGMWTHAILRAAAFVGLVFAASILISIVYARDLGA